MDAFLEMSTTLGELPIPNGPEPAVYQHELNLQGLEYISFSIAKSYLHLKCNF
jgi:hypothetical protein